MTTELERISRLEGIVERTNATLDSIERRLESLHAEMLTGRTEMLAGQDALRGEMLAGDAALRADIQALEAAMRAEMKSNTRNIIIAIAGVGTAMFAVMAGAIITFILRF